MAIPPWAAQEVMQVAFDAMTASDALILGLLAVYRVHGKKTMTDDGIAEVEKYIAAHDHARRQFDDVVRPYRLKR